MVVIYSAVEFVCAYYNIVTLKFDPVGLACGWVL